MEATSVAELGRRGPRPGAGVVGSVPLRWLPRSRIAFVIGTVILSRCLVVLAATAGSLLTGSRPAWEGFDPSGITVKLGSLGNVLSAAAVRWDAIHYLHIAAHGYTQPGDTAFFPGYPLAVHAAGWLIGSDVLAGATVSLVAYAAALFALSSLAELELGPRAARWTVLILGFAPLSLFFSAVYTESLFLALSVGSLLAARTSRWRWAIGLGALASVTRVTGVLLALPLLATWYETRPRSPGRLLSVGVLPVALLSYLGYLASRGFGFFSPFLQQLSIEHGHQIGGPTATAVAAVQAAGRGLRLLTSGIEHVYMPSIRGPLSLGAESILLLGVLAAAIAGLTAVWRRLPLAYGLYALASLLVCVWSPSAGQPLVSLDRYVLTIFPLWMVLGRSLSRRRILGPAVLVLSACLLVFYAYQFATWAFVA